MKDFDSKRSQSFFERSSASRHAHINHILTTPTKRELREDLARAVRNTAELPIPTEGETDASDH